MSRLLSKALFPHGRFFLRRFNDSPAPAVPNFVYFSRRFSSKPQLIEYDLDSKTEAEAAILKNLNEFVLRIIVRNSTPDWLPFSPGASFWVPPHQNTAENFANFVDEVNNRLKEDKSLALSSPYGWPSYSFFIPPDNSSSTQEIEASMDLNIPEENEMLEVNLANFPDPTYSFRPEDYDEEVTPFQLSSRLEETHDE